MSSGISYISFRVGAHSRTIAKKRFQNIRGGSTKIKNDLMVFFKYQKNRVKRTLLGVENIETNGAIMTILFGRIGAICEDRSDAVVTLANDRVILGNWYG